MTIPTQGWDSDTTVVDHRWIDRSPRHPTAEAGLRLETRLMPWLARHLPLPVPRPTVHTENPLTVRHHMIVGAELTHPTQTHGAVMGEFLRVLHGIPLPSALDHGLPTPTATRADRADTLEDFAIRVLPLLPADRRRAGKALLDEVRGYPADTLVHGDLGPEHILVDPAGIAGVIDWSDAHAGDPAVDLAWLLHHTPAECADAFAAVYGVTPAQRVRAAGWDRLGPWYEVVYGLDNHSPAHVVTGLDGVLERL